MTIPLDYNGRPVQVFALGGTTEEVTIGPSSQQSAVITDGVDKGYWISVNLTANVDCFITAGANPTATAASKALFADTEYNFAVKSGWKIAVIQAAAGGTLKVTPAGTL